MIRQILALALALACLAIVSAIPIQSADDTQVMDELEKRGGARSFFGSQALGSKRLADPSGIYFFQKRGGGRAFYGWGPESMSGRMERRGGGRAFASFAGQPATAGEGAMGFYDSPYYRKRSNGDLWEFLESKRYY